MQYAKSAVILFLKSYFYGNFMSEFRDFFLLFGTRERALETFSGGISSVHLSILFIFL